MRRAIIAALILGLLAGALAAPADAKKKKKPVKFTATGSLATSNPGDLEGAGVTRNEFLANCAVPASQGLDGYVIAVPAKLSKLTSKVQLMGSDATGTYDVDMYFFNSSCGDNGSVSTPSSTESGVMPPGTAYVLVSAFFGAQIDFTFSAIGS